MSSDGPRTAGESAPGTSRGGSRGSARGRGVVRAVAELYLRGLTPDEIAECVFGSSEPRFKKRVFRYVWYARKTGLLNRLRSEIHEDEIVPDFRPGSRYVSFDKPFLGSFNSIKQLKASLNHREAKLMRILEFIDEFLGVIEVHSIVKESASLIARLNIDLSIKFKYSNLAIACCLASLLTHTPSLVREFIEVLKSRGVNLNDVLECLGSIRLPTSMVSSVLRNYLLCLMG